MYILPKSPLYMHVQKHAFNKMMYCFIGMYNSNVIHYHDLLGRVSIRLVQTVVHWWGRNWRSGRPPWFGPWTDPAVSLEGAGAQVYQKNQQLKADSKFLMGIYDIHYLHKSLEGFELKMISWTIFHYAKLCM